MFPLNMITKNDNALLGDDNRKMIFKNMLTKLIRR